MEPVGTQPVHGQSGAGHDEAGLPDRTAVEARLPRVRHGVGIALGADHRIGAARHDLDDAVRHDGAAIGRRLERDHLADADR